MLGALVQTESFSSRNLQLFWVFCSSVIGCSSPVGVLGGFLCGVMSQVFPFAMSQSPITDFSQSLFVSSNMLYNECGNFISSANNPVPKNNNSRECSAE
jgi:hypothetical protein